MFKVPDWEDDTSKVNLSFPMKAKTNIRRKKNSLETPKLKGVIKPKLKTKNSLNQNIKVVNKKQNALKGKSAKPSENNILSGDYKVIPNIKKHSPKRSKLTKIQHEVNDNKKSVADNKIDDKLFDADKLDELILNEKKEKLNSYKKDDIEEILFNDISENLKKKHPSFENNKSFSKIVETREDEKKEGPKSKLQKRNRNNSVTKILPQLKNQIPTTKDDKIKKLQKLLLFQNDNKNKLENEKTKDQSESQILKIKNERKKKDQKSELLQNVNINSIVNEKTKEGYELESQKLRSKNERKKKDPKSKLLQNGNKNNLVHKETKEGLQLENQNPKTKEERKKRVQNSILQNVNRNNSVNKISKEINTLSGGNKIIKIKDNKKKEALKTILQSESLRNSINVGGDKLRARMLERLKAAQFRYLNEKLYTSSGSDAKQLFQEDPKAFQTYHEGYQQQVKRWPVKPLDVIVKRIQKMPKTHTIADMGCGEAELSTRVVQPVRSFDLVATKPGVETCDMAHTPLLSSSMDVAVYCLALMGTDLTQYLIEANRVLKVGGHLLIAEVESRFHDVDSFTRDVQKLGFSLKKIDKSQQVFFFMEFTKAREPPVKKAKLPVLSLKPCIYKKR